MSGKFNRSANSGYDPSAGMIRGFTPRALGASLYLWLRADRSFVTLDGTNNVQSWQDVSGYDRHATQATPANRPLYQASNPNLNGRPSLLFDGGDVLTNAGAMFAGNATHSIYVVGRVITPANATGLLCAGSTTAGTRNTSTIGQWVSGTLKWWYDGDDTLSTFGSVAAGDTTKHILSKTYDSASTVVTGYKDGVLDATTVYGAATPNLTAGYAIGSYSGGLLGASHCEITEVLMLNIVPSAAINNSIIRYLRTPVAI